MCSSCTARQQELNRLKKHVRAIEAKLALLSPSEPELQREAFRCVACGHLHPKTITRHHRVPSRIAWKIPHAARKEILGYDPEIVNLCEQCHRFVETASSTSRPNVPINPCPQPIAPEVTITWKRLMDEIRMFERIAEDVTEDIMSVIREADPGLSEFAEKLNADQRLSSFLLS